MTSLFIRGLFLCLSLWATGSASAQTVLNAQQRWQKLCEIRQAKFDQILPDGMRENHIDVWIVAVMEGHDDPMAAILGEGEPAPKGPSLYIFSDRGQPRIERTLVDLWVPLQEDCPSYDSQISTKELQAFVAERHPRRIAVNMSDELGTADGL